jgi:hypothetical protein
MTDAQILFVTLIAIYLLECTKWVRREAVAFVGRPGGPWRLLRSPPVLGNGADGLVFASPLLPLGTLFRVQQWPLSMSPEGVYAYVAQSVQTSGRPIQGRRFVRFDAMEEVSWAGRDVFIDGERFLRVCAPALARELAGLIDELREADPQRRDGIMLQALAQTQDIPAIEEALGRFQSKTPWLRTLVSLDFIALFLGGPLLFMRTDVEQSWPWLLGAGLLLGSATALAFFRAHQALHPEERGERWAHLVTVALFPPAAVRALDLVAVDLLARWHPLSVAKVLLENDAWEAFARHVLRDLHHPIAPTCPDDDPPACAAEARTRAALLALVTTEVEAAGGSAADLLRPPPATEDCHSYCPRCHEPFIPDAVTCPACHLVTVPVPRVAVRRDAGSCGSPLGSPPRPRARRPDQME